MTKTKNSIIKINYQIFQRGHTKLSPDKFSSKEPSDVECNLGKEHQREDNVNDDINGNVRSKIENQIAKDTVLDQQDLFSCTSSLLSFATPDFNPGKNHSFSSSTNPLDNNDFFKSERSSMKGKYNYAPVEVGLENDCGDSTRTCQTENKFDREKSSDPWANAIFPTDEKSVRGNNDMEGIMPWDEDVSNSKTEERGRRKSKQRNDATSSNRCRTNIISSIPEGGKIATTNVKSPLKTSPQIISKMAKDSQPIIPVLPSKDIKRTNSYKERRKNYQRRRYHKKEKIKEISSHPMLPLGQLNTSISTGSKQSVFSNETTNAAAVVTPDAATTRSASFHKVKDSMNTISRNARDKRLYHNSSNGSNSAHEFTQCLLPHPPSIDVNNDDAASIDSITHEIRGDPAVTTENNCAQQQGEECTTTVYDLNHEKNKHNNHSEPLLSKSGRSFDSMDNDDGPKHMHNVNCNTNIVSPKFVNASSVSSGGNCPPIRGFGDKAKTAFHSFPSNDTASSIINQQQNYNDKQLSDSRSTEHGTAHISVITLDCHGEEDTTTQVSGLSGTQISTTSSSAFFDNSHNHAAASVFRNATCAQAQQATTTTTTYNRNSSSCFARREEQFEIIVTPSSTAMMAQSQPMINQASAITFPTSSSLLKINNSVSFDNSASSSAFMVTNSNAATSKLQKHKMENPKCYKQLTNHLNSFESCESSLPNTTLSDEKNCSDSHSISTAAVTASLKWHQAENRHLKEEIKGMHKLCKEKDDMIVFLSKRVELLMVELNRQHANKGGGPGAAATGPNTVNQQGQQQPPLPPPQTFSRREINKLALAKMNQRDSDAERRFLC